MPQLHLSAANLVIDVVLTYHAAAMVSCDSVLVSLLRCLGIRVRNGIAY
jgi:hypothetical protein